MPSIDAPRLLGERDAAATQTRQAIQRKLLARRSLAPTNYEAIRHLVNRLLNEAAALRDQLKGNPNDEQKRRLCRALIAEAVYLASDDKGRLVLWLRKWCIDLTWITKDTPLLPLALKAFGPYNYDGDAQQRRNSDKKVSRDYKAIVACSHPMCYLPIWLRPGTSLAAELMRPRAPEEPVVRNRILMDQSGSPPPLTQKCTSARPGIPIGRR
jgi:hypothetical protein